jgi:serine/threonine protein kinase
MKYYQFNLNHFIKENMEIKNIFKIIEKLNSILFELNSKNMIFRNIKPENIFIVNNNGNLDDNFEIILSDCCNAYLVIYNKYNKLFSFNNYFAPEIRGNQGIDKKSDIWSLGKLFYYMLFFKHFTCEEYDFDFFNYIKNKEFKNFLFSLVKEEIKSRTTWEKYFEDFTKFKNEISDKNYDDIIDFSKINSNLSSNILFQPTTDFFNIIIELTKLSKKEYVNNDILYPEDFDIRGNRQPYEYSKNQKRGNEDYFPPIGWTGIGLNITKYDNWEIKCGNINKKGEWCVAYHGTCLENAKNIIIEGLKEGSRQHYQDYKDKEGNQIGTGVYFARHIEKAEKYSKPCNGIQCVFMCRINPEKMKKIPKHEVYVVNDPRTDAIPYRLLIKKGCKHFFVKNIIQKHKKIIIKI